MLELFFLTLLSFQVNPKKGYAVLIHLKYSPSQPITLSIKDTSWVLTINKKLAYTLFHTHELEEPERVRIYLGDSAISSAYLVEIDTAFTINPNSSFTFARKAYTISGLLMIPYPTFKLDSLKIATNFALYDKKLKLIGERRWTRRVIYPILFLSGNSNRVWVFGDGTAKIFLGRASLLK